MLQRVLLWYTYCAAESVIKVYFVLQRVLLGYIYIVLPRVLLGYIYCAADGADNCEWECFRG